MLITISSVGLGLNTCSYDLRICSSKWFVFVCLLFCSTVDYFCEHSIRLSRP
jgi:hypothetical protein